jgi:hypothetical protein
MKDRCTNNEQPVTKGSGISPHATYLFMRRIGLWGGRPMRVRLCSVSCSETILIVRSAVADTVQLHNTGFEQYLCAVVLNLSLLPSSSASSAQTCVVRIAIRPQDLSLVISSPPSSGLMMSLLSSSSLVAPFTKVAPEPSQWSARRLTFHCYSTTSIV